MDSWLVCHEFAPSTTKDPPCREDQDTLNLSKLKRPPVGVVRTLKEEDASSGAVPLTRPWFKITCSVAKGPRAVRR
ncbi:hypothetical protein TNCV_897111 [Trichonephila clavipes]|nr:hypothetical protein TNCV_897111 [Trichonephila clavipes]